MRKGWLVVVVLLSPIGALGALQVAAASPRDPGSPIVVPPSGPARSCGVGAYRVEHVDRRSVRVSWSGGSLESSGDDAGVVQRLVLGERSFELATTAARVDVRGPPNATPAELTRAVHVAMAVDTDMAVQGSSLVFGGRVHTSCTLQCLRAFECTSRSSIEAPCERSIALCGGCMVQTP